MRPGARYYRRIGANLFRKILSISRGAAPPAENSTEGVMKTLLRALISPRKSRSPAPAGTLEIPDDTVLRKAGFDVQTLRRRSILPQKSAIAPAGYALVVAYTDSICIREFEQSGVQILSGQAADIEAVWQ